MHVAHRLDARPAAASAEVGRPASDARPAAAARISGHASQQQRDVLARVVAAPDEDDRRAIETREPALVGLRTELVDVDRDAQNADLLGGKSRRSGERGARCRTRRVDTTGAPKRDPFKPFQQWGVGGEGKAACEREPGAPGAPFIVERRGDPRRVGRPDRAAGYPYGAAAATTQTLRASRAAAAIRPARSSWLTESANGRYG